MRLVCREAKRCAAERYNLSMGGAHAAGALAGAEPKPVEYNGRGGDYSLILSLMPERGDESS